MGNKHDSRRHMGKQVGEGYAFPKKACFVCGSLSHLIKDYDFHEKRMAQEQAMAKQNEKTNGMGNFNRKWDKMTIWENTQRVDPSNKIVPHAVLLQSGIVDLSSTRPNCLQQYPTGDKLSKPVTTGNEICLLRSYCKAVCHSGNLHKLTEDLGIVDSGCFRSMTRNRHRTFGHGKESVKYEQIVKGNLVRGYPPQNFFTELPYIVGLCNKGKPHNVSYNGAAKTAMELFYVSALQMLHMDLLDPRL
ncbi:hypothetical protein Tco_0602244 [Tanacetum coccineum]